MSSLFRTRARPMLASAVVGLSLAAGCGGDDDETAVAAPPSPATVTIEAITSSSGQPFNVDTGPDAPRFIEVGCDPGRTVTVSLKLGNFLLHPPGSCGGNPNCGTVRVSVESSGIEHHSVRSSASAPSLPLASLPSIPGEYVFRAQLLNDAGDPFPLGDPEDSVTVEVRLPSACSVPDASPDSNPPHDAGADSTPDAGSDASDAAPDHSVTDAPLDTRPDAGDGAVQG